jgi:hypothetical protein
MPSSSDNIFGITATQVVLPTGATNAVLIDHCPYAQSTVVKYASGSSLIYLFGVGTGQTLTGTSLVAGYSTGYLLGGTEVLSFDGSTRFYAASVGATGVIYLMRGLSVGSP